MRKKFPWSKYTNTRHNDPEFDKVRRRVFKRDGHKCQFPGCTKKGLKLHCHHIIRFADSLQLRMSERNLITLCSYHHKMVVTGNETLYQGLFQRIVNEKLRPK